MIWDKQGCSWFFYILYLTITVSVVFSLTFFPQEIYSCGQQTSHHTEANQLWKRKSIPSFSLANHFMRLVLNLLSLLHYPGLISESKSVVTTWSVKRTWWKKIYDIETELQSTTANISSPVLTSWGYLLWRLLWDMPCSLHFQEVGNLAQTDHLVGLVFWSLIQPVKYLLGTIFLGGKTQCLQVTLWKILQNHFSMKFLVMSHGCLQKSVGQGSQSFSMLFFVDVFKSC